MARPRKILNVKSHLEHTILTCKDMLERDGKYEGGLRLAPIDRDNLNQLRFLAEAILRKHAVSRKDVPITK